MIINLENLKKFMFINNINPTLLQLGPFEIRYYGIIFALGFLITLFYLKWQVKKKNLDLSDEQIDNLIFYCIIGVVIFARLFHIIFWEPKFYLNNPLEIFKVWRGGLAYYGGLAGVLIAVMYFCKKNRFSFLKLMDFLSIPAIFGLALGRIANFTNSELYGTVTNLSWCVQFQNVEGCRHPYQIYSAIKRFSIVIYLVLIDKGKHKDGFVFASALALMSLGRFLLDFVREDTRFLFTPGQYLSIIVLIIGIYLYRKTR